MDDFDGQMEDAISFLERHFEELKGLADTTSIRYRILSFTVILNVSGVSLDDMRKLTIPVRFVRLASDLNLSLSLDLSPQC
jgi:hypothetical protein